jgi:hypothetical protein
MTIYEVSSLSSLGLFGQATLTNSQLKLLPKGALSPILEGFSKLINQYIQNQSGKVVPSSVRVSNGGEVLVGLSSGSEVVVGRLDHNPKIMDAAQKILDLARVRIPSAFRDVAPKLGPDVPACLIDLPPTKENILAGESTAVSTNVNSVGRNLSIATGAFAAGVAFSGVLGGISSIAIAQSIINTNNTKLHNAELCYDKEGIIDATLGRGVGRTFGVVGASMVTGFAPGVLNLMPHNIASMCSQILLPVTTAIESSTGINVAAAMGIAGNVAIIGMAGYMFAQNAYSWYHLSKFRDELHGILDNKTLDTQEKAVQGLSFLEQQITLTEGEYIDLKGTYADDPNELKKMIENKVKEKYARLVRRVGSDCAKKIVSQVALLKAAIASGDADAVIKAIDLLEEVDQASYKTRVKQAIGLLLSFLYCTVGILSFTTPLGPLVPVLFALGAAIFILIDSSEAHTGITYIASKIHKAANRLFASHLDDEMTRWGSLDRYVSNYKQDGKWNLKRLEDRLVKAIARTDLQIDGEQIVDIARLKEKLRLDSLDFKKDADDRKITLQQLRSLKFLSEMLAGIVDSAKNPGVKADLGRIRVDATIAPETGIGTIRVESDFS